MSADLELQRCLLASSGRCGVRGERACCLARGGTQEPRSQSRTGPRGVVGGQALLLLDQLELLEELVRRHHPRHLERKT